MLPHPAQENGGLPPVPAGYDVVIDLGAARRLSDLTVSRLASAVTQARLVNIVGEDPWAVAEAFRATVRHLDGEGL
ncbi:hypothetical protein ACFCX4_08925 [Kitasatospora sp. NPDC056327]|uniref:hypothetical protein n=1 Tax=Kitasatospora sp. NPDC056327 TaxID=3345785 RepID=UPI0035DE8DD5